MASKNNDRSFQQSTEDLVEFSERMFQMLERVLADKASHGLLSHSIENSPGVPLSSPTFNPSAYSPQKVPEVVKDILAHQFDNDDDDDDTDEISSNLYNGDRYNIGHTPKVNLSLTNYSPSRLNSSNNKYEYNTMPSHSEEPNKLRRENEHLRDNLNCVEKELLTMQTERDQLAIRFNALNERVTKSSEHGGPITNGTDTRKYSIISDENSLAQINQQLRKQIEQDNKNYRQKLSTQQEQQFKQSDLIKKLQAKLSEFEGSGGLIHKHQVECDRLRAELSKLKQTYQTTANDMNRRLEQAESKYKASETDRNLNSESLMMELKEEQEKSANLAQVNSLLREQLDEATLANQGLSDDLEKLSKDWHDLRSELNAREHELKEDEATFNRYINSEENRIRTLHSGFTSFKKHFNEVKNSNERALHQLRSDMENTTQSLRLACSNLDTNIKNKTAQLEFQLETERANSAQLEAALAKSKEELHRTETQYQKQLEAIKENFNQVNKTNEQYMKELKDKDRILNTLKNLRNGNSADLENGSGMPEDAATRQLILDTDAIHQALRDIAQLVMTDNVGSNSYQGDVFIEQEDDGGIDGGQQNNLLKTLSTNSLHSNRSTSPIRKPGGNNTIGSLDRQQLRQSYKKSPIAIADSTCSAVRSALQKRAMQVQELTSKYNQLKSSSGQLKRNLDESETERRHLEKQFIDLRQEFDQNHRELDDLHRECERQKQTILVLEDDKLKLDKTRCNTVEETNILKQELEKMKSVNYELQRDKESAMDKCEDHIKNIERQMRETERLQKNLENSEGKNSKLREDIAALREAYNKLIIEKEVLEQEKTIVQESLNTTEMTKAEFEVKTNKLRTDEAKLKDKLVQMESTIHSLQKDNTELKVFIEQVEMEKKRLAADKKSLEQEKYGIREELLRVENEKEELSQVKDGLHHSIQNVEKSREQLQSDISRLNCEKADLETGLNSLQRERNTLSNELLQARRDAERLSAAVQKLMKEKDNINKEKNEMMAQIKSCEREMRSNSETIYMLQNEKEQLDSTLYESQQLIQQLESQIEGMECNLQQLERKRVVLQDEKQKQQHEFDVELQKLNKLKDNLQNRLTESENDWSKKLKLEKKNREEDIERLVAEREELQSDFNKYKESILMKHQEEFEQMSYKNQMEKEEMAQEIITIQRERDDSLLESEMSKQHAISVLQQDKNACQEKLSMFIEKLKITETEFDRFKSDTEARSIQDLNTIQTLNSDLKKFRIQMEQTHADHDREIKSLQATYRDLENLRYQDQREFEELKALLKIAEDTRDSLKQDLNEALAKIRDLEDMREKLRRELAEEKRNYHEEKRENDTLQLSNKELRQKLKQAELTKIELQKHLQENQAKLTSVEEQRSALQRDYKDTKYGLQETEKARAEARKELEDLRHQIKKIDSEKGKFENEVANLQMRISADESKEVETRRECFGLRQKVMESEATKEDLLKQLSLANRKIEDLEDTLTDRDRINKQEKEDMLKDLKQLSDLRQSLEKEIDLLNLTIEELRNEMGNRESRISVLENQLANLDQRKRVSDSKLAAIHGHLRKLLGFRQHVGVNVAGGGAMLGSSRAQSPNIGLRSRSASPEKSRMSSRTSLENFQQDDIQFTSRRGRTSTNEGLNGAQVPGSDLDPESVRLALRDVTQHITTLERHRDDMDVKLKNLSVKNEDTTEQLDQALTRISELQRIFGEVEEDKRGVDTRLSSAQTALMMQEETIHRNERERKTMVDKLAKLERQLSHTESEKRFLQEKIDKMRNSELYQEEEKRNLIKAVDDAENRCTQLELMRRGLEGELQRVKMGFNDKETENQVLRDRVDSLTKQISDLESKAQNLQLTIDRLSMSLSRTEEEENSHKDRVQQLSMSLSEYQGTMQNLQDKITQLQSNLASSEHDRRIVQERLDSVRQSLTEAKSQNHTLSDKLQITQQELSDCESRKKEVESEMKRLSQLLSQRQEVEQELQTKIHKTAMEKNLLTERLNGLTASLAGLENERRDIERIQNKTEKEKLTLKKSLDKLEKEKMKTDEYASQSMLKRGEFDDVLRKLEDENDILHRQVQKLQIQLADAEQGHSQRLMDLSSRIKTEMLSEIDRLKSALSSTEKTLQFRERSHRQKVKSLEEQISTLKDQLGHELRKRETYLNKSARQVIPDFDTYRSTVERNSQQPISVTKRSVENLLHELESRRLQESVQYDAGYSTCASPSSTLKLSQRNMIGGSGQVVSSSRLDTSLPRGSHNPNRITNKKPSSKQKIHS